MTKETIKVGSFVKDKKMKGIVYHISGTNVIVEYHNGMKPSTCVRDINKLIIITRRELFDYWKKRGDTAMMVKI